MIRWQKTMHRFESKDTMIQSYGEDMVKDTILWNKVGDVLVENGKITDQTVDEGEADTSGASQGEADASDDAQQEETAE